jgi:hypothetical protein
MKVILFYNKYNFIKKKIVKRGTPKSLQTFYSLKNVFFYITFFWINNINKLFMANKKIYLFNIK